MSQKANGNATARMTTAYTPVIVGWTTEPMSASKAADVDEAAGSICICTFLLYF
jgi:hypothetical protein